MPTPLQERIAKTKSDLAACEAQPSLKAHAAILSELAAIAGELELIASKPAPSAAPSPVAASSAHLEGRVIKLEKAMEQVAKMLAPAS